MQTVPVQVDSWTSGKHSVALVGRLLQPVLIIDAPLKILIETLWKHLRLLASLRGSRDQLLVLGLLYHDRLS